MSPEILFEDKDILVCKKPAGIPTQTRQLTQNDMVSLMTNYLRQAYPDQKPYLALIHRLDQPVEGLLVFAKTPAAARSLNRQLSSSQFQKYYLAELSAFPPREEDTLENYLIRDSKTNTSRVCEKNTPGAKFARLSYQVVRRTDIGAVVEILLDTGRHHQIRAQMAHIGCPILGDRKYGSDGTVSSLQLFAYRLSFLHPSTGERMDFSYEPKMISEKDN